MSGHYLVRCTGCKAIIEQCRCPGPKVEREGRCNTCETPDEIAALRARVAELEQEKAAGQYEGDLLRAEVESVARGAKIEADTNAILRAEVERLREDIEEKEGQRREWADECGREKARAEKAEWQRDEAYKANEGHVARAEKAEREVERCRIEERTYVREYNAQLMEDFSAQVARAEVIETQRLQLADLRAEVERVTDVAYSHCLRADAREADIERITAHYAGAMELANRKVSLMTELLRRAVPLVVFCAPKDSTLAMISEGGE